MKFSQKSNIPSYAFLAIFSFVLLFLISPDSYTHDAYNRMDSAWFFMCGKAWMNGMIPYVDFSDSKGPFLWFIYGIGYLLSHNSYHGIFWISWIWYVAIYAFTFKTALIFLREPLKAFICTILLTLSFFNPWFHYETRAEDFTLLFLVISLYTVSSQLYSEDKKPNIYRSFGILGACFTALLLIKFNIAAMQTVFPFYLYYYCIRNRFSYIKPIIYGLAGVLLAGLPFFIYFMFANNLDDFIHEYFLSTMSTDTHDSMIKVYLKEWKDVINDPARLTLFAVIVTGCLQMSKKLETDRYFPLISSLFVFALTVRHSLWSYYFNSCSFLVIWFLTYIILDSNSILRARHALIISLTVFSFSAFTNIFTKQASRPIFFHHYPEKEHFYKISEIMARTPNPTLINAGYHEFGYGIKAHSLPGAKYWTLQNGAPITMINEHRKEILSGKSDYIFVYNTTILQRANLTLDELRHAGYATCYEWGDSNDRHYLMTKINPK